MHKNRLRNAPFFTALAAACCAFCTTDRAAAQIPGDTPADSQDEVDLTPKRYNLDRYKSIWSERSPFEIIVEDAEEEIDETPPFEDYSLAGYVKRGNVWHVTVVNIKDPKEKHYLQSGQVSKDGFELLNFKPERNYKNSEIVVRRGGKSGSIGFDEKRLKPATGVKGGAPGIAAKAGSTRTNPNQRGGNQPTPGKSGQPVNNANAQNDAKKSDAAAQIRQMLQNRANQPQGRGGRGGDSQRQPRRRVILPPSR